MPEPGRKTKLIRIFVGSPNDVPKAREIIKNVAEELNKVWIKNDVLLYVLNWQDHVTPYLGKVPEETILEKVPVDTWDVFMGVLWSRMGTPTERTNPETGLPYQSGTEEEFILAYRLFQKKNYPKLLLYRCLKKVSPDATNNQLDLVNKFFELFAYGGKYFGLVSKYRSDREFKELVYRHLLGILNDWQSGKIPQAIIEEPRNRGVKEWLETFGFDGHPFSFHEAGPDTALPKYFTIAIPFYEEIVGNTGNIPLPEVILGEQGIGKTALSCMVAFECSFHPGPGGRNVLAVPYNKFDLLAEKQASGAKISARDHVQLIIQAALGELAPLTGKSSRPLELIPRVGEDERREFQKYLLHFGKNLEGSQLAYFRQALSLNEPARLPDLPESYVSLFHRFCRSIHIFGYDMLYVLLDGVDECSFLSSDLEIISLLAPLMADLSLIESTEGRFTFRFFLPARLEEPLKRNRIRLGERILSRYLTWKDEDLKSIITRRLTYYSRNGLRVYARMAELAENIPDLDSRLIQAAHGNPRTLIRLCREVISQHCRMGFDENNLLISQTDLEDALENLHLSITGKTKYIPVVSINKTEPAQSEPTESRFTIPDHQQTVVNLMLNQTRTEHGESWLPTPMTALLALYQREQDAYKKMWHAHILTQRILQYLGCLLIVLYKKHGELDNELDERLCALVFSEKPPALGSWREAIDRIIKAKETINHPLVDKIAKFRMAKEVGQSINGLIEIRNDSAHGRSEEPNRQKMEAINRYLISLIDNLQTMRSTLLLSIEGVEVNREDQIVHQAQVYRGNVLIPEKIMLNLDRNYQRQHVVLYDVEMQRSIDLWPLMMMTYALEDIQPANRDILLYEKIVYPNSRKQISAEYSGLIDNSKIQTNSPIETMHRMGLVK